MSTDTTETAAPHKFKLSKETRDAIVVAKELLSDEIGEHRNAWDDKPERWQEGDRGEAVDTWISELDDLWETLDEPPLEPDYI